MKYIHQNTGTNRRERRHFTDVNGKKHRIPKRWQAPAENQPYIKEDTMAREWNGDDEDTRSPEEILAERAKEEEKNEEQSG